MNERCTLLFANLTFFLVFLSPSPFPPLLPSTQDQGQNFKNCNSTFTPMNIRAWI